MDIYHEILQKYWGYTSFRPLQEDIIHSVSEGRDTMGLMPTGGGKSITFQVPAMTMDGVCIVVTPLIALMRDQVDNLRRLGIKATAVYSGMSREEIITQLENCIFGNYKFLYVSPERLSTEIFQAKLKAIKVSLLVVDESHCISQWGYDFRPSYLKIADIRDQLPGVPVLALTATATPDVVNDIQDRLRFKEHNVFQKSFVRKNLAYIVRHTEDKQGTLTHILSRVPGTAIVYVRNRKKTKEIALQLQQAGFTANFYHAGLNREEKERRQTQWKNGECRIIVSTNAFGMGIDKPDVRLVVHIDMPGSLEEYYQEAGRAGRDGEKAFAVALCGDADIAKLKKRLSDEYPEKAFIKRVYEALGNFYQIAVGFGLDSVHDFSLAQFCAAYKFPLLQAHHALKILELSGYIEYTEEQENASRLMFICNREDLYSHLQQSPTIDRAINTILRTYTGLFADYVYINEGLISTRSGIGTDELYSILVQLSKYRIISYIPHKKTPMIIYTQPREDLEYLTIPPCAYEERKSKSEVRIGKVIDYLQNEVTCRSQLLISYFGEKGTDRCQQCDVCIAHRKEQLTDEQLKAIQAEVMAALSEGEANIDDLIAASSYTKEDLIKALRFMADQDAGIVLSGKTIRHKE